jgi:hypothetical protein
MNTLSPILGQDEQGREQKQWLERMRSLGRLQARYLWFLIIA